MKNTFTLLDIALLKKSFENATIANDCLPRFLNTYHFDDAYETEDRSIVFDAGGVNRIELEFFSFNHPLKRYLQVSYFENGEYKLLEFGKFEG